MTYDYTIVIQGSIEVKNIDEAGDKIRTYLYYKPDPGTVREANINVREHVEFIRGEDCVEASR